uniref:Uncharacterized protein n=1 Tax=Cacopsylla melanoneura TaxID=428564 RepID=A0A8D8THH2_9HEMI
MQIPPREKSQISRIPNRSKVMAVFPFFHMYICARNVTIRKIRALLMSNPPSLILSPCHRRNVKLQNTGPTCTYFSFGFSQTFPTEFHPNRMKTLGEMAVIRIAE